MWRKQKYNEVLERKGWSVSYVADTGANPMAKVFDDAIEAIAGKKLRGDSETALIIHGEGMFGQKFYILNGDFRKQYEKAKTKAEALKVYKKLKPKYGSEMSDK